MFVGFGPEKGKRVEEEDAFGYAMERCTSDCIDDFCKEFADQVLITINDVKDFREKVVEWFYSGNWVKEVENA